MQRGNSSIDEIDLTAQTYSEQLPSWSGNIHKEDWKMKYRVHKFTLRMTEDQDKLELFLNSLEGEVVAVIPNVTPFPANYVNFVLVVEKRG